MDRLSRIGQMYRMAQTLCALRSAGRLVPEAIGTDPLQSLAASKALEEIGNQAWELGKAEEYPDLGVPSRALSGMRHHMAHAYSTVDWTLVRATVSNDIEPLRNSLRRTLEADGVDCDAIDAEIARKVNGPRDDPGE